MGNHNLHKIGLTFSGEEEEEAIRLRDPETNEASSKFFLAQVAIGRRTSASGLRASLEEDYPCSGNSSCCSLAGKTMTSGPPHLRLCWMMDGKSVSECPNPTLIFSLTQAIKSLHTGPSREVPFHSSHYLSHFTVLFRKRGRWGQQSFSKLRVLSLIIMCPTVHTLFL